MYVCVSVIYSRILIAIHTVPNNFFIALKQGIKCNHNLHALVGEHLESEERVL